MRTAEINLSAILTNYQIFKKLTTAKVMAVVKADAYGHGIVEVSKHLEQNGVDFLGTADVYEALTLRAAGIRTRILAWLHSPSVDFTESVAHDIELGIATKAALDQAAKAAGAAGKPAIVHLKVDTGLGRNGATPDQFDQLVSKALELETAGSIRLIGIMSHLSGTSTEDDLAQVKVFKELVSKAEQMGANFELRHIVASLGALSYPEAHLDMVRVGLSLYGLYSNQTVRDGGFGLVPAMTVKSEVVLVKRVPANHGVSYGYLYKTPNETTLALVPFGYFDGFPRVATGKAKVLLNGKLYPVISRISMDQFVLDVGEDQVTVGDEVVIFGDAAKGEPNAEDLAIAAQTIQDEIVTGIGGRTRRVFR